jgi:hypothetical protein
MPPCAPHLTPSARERQRITYPSQAQGWRLDERERYDADGSCAVSS